MGMFYLSFVYVVNNPSFQPVAGQECADGLQHVGGLLVALVGPLDLVQQQGVQAATQRLEREGAAREQASGVCEEGGYMRGYVHE